MARANHIGMSEEFLPTMIKGSKVNIISLDMFSEYLVAKNV